MVPETRVFQAADGEDLVILACTALTDLPVWQADRQTDRRTELRWLRRCFQLFSRVKTITKH